MELISSHTVCVVQLCGVTVIAGRLACKLVTNILASEVAYRTVRNEQRMEKEVPAQISGLEPNP